MPTTHRWSASIPFLPPSAMFLGQMSPPARKESQTLWFGRLKKAFHDAPKAHGRRRVSIRFFHAPESAFDPEAAAVDYCLLGPLCPQNEIAGRFSKGRRTGSSFFPRNPGLGLILGGREGAWVEVKVSSEPVQGLWMERTEILLEDIAAGDLPKDRQVELCAYTEELERHLHALTGSFAYPDGDIARTHAQEAAKALLLRPTPRLLDLHRRGQMVVDTGQEAS